MARSRRRSSGGFRRNRVGLDWVQNEQCYSEDFTTVTSGVAGAVTGVLLPSHQSRQEWQYIGGAGPGPVNMSAAAFPSINRRQVVRAVRGWCFVSPLGWAAGNVRSWCLRFSSYLQDPEQGDLLVPQGYTALNASPVPLNDPYVWADEPFATEYRRRIAYSPDSPTPNWNFKVNWSGRKVLEADEAFGFYLETFGGDTVWQMWLRCLVEVPRAGNTA